MSNATALKTNINVVIPRAGKLPSDIAMVFGLSTLVVAPNKSDDKLFRSDYIGSLIETALRDE
jgi:hypothetical protein